MSSNCIFSCNEVICSKDNLYSFQNIICSSHLKEIFGLKIFAFKSETETATEQCGPFLTPDDHYSFPPNTVVVPTKTFLDSHLLPSENADFNYKFTQNSRLQTYYNNLRMRRCYFKDLNTYQYHYELIRNLFECSIDSISLSNLANSANIELLKHIQDRIAKMNNWIKNEPYYKNFEKMKLKLFTDNKEVSLAELPPFIGFILYNTVFDKCFLPFNTGAPLMCYANLSYIPEVGLVTVQEVKNNIPLVVIGEMQSNLAYLQHKTHIEPKQVVVNRLTNKNFPDTNRSHNVISSNKRFCN